MICGLPVLVFWARGDSSNPMILLLAQPCRLVAQILQPK